MWNWNETAKQYQYDTGNEFLGLHKRRGNIWLEYITTEEEWTYQSRLSFDINTEKIEINRRKFKKDGENMQRIEAMPYNFLQNRQLYTEGEGLSEDFKEFSKKVFDGLDKLVN
tara:strand:+ start:24752 stop:25090 length:339 start_codon:yes stop_codon:yes gene_type:complete